MQTRWLVPRCFHLIKANYKHSTISNKAFTVGILNTLPLAHVHFWLPGITLHMQTLKKQAHRKGCFNIAVSKLYLHFQYELGFSGMYLSPRKVNLGFQKLFKIFFENYFSEYLPFPHSFAKYNIRNQMLSNINSKIIKISSPKLFAFSSKFYKIIIIKKTLRNQH